MDTNAMEECVRKLGYYAPLPKSLFKNPSTAFIWQQFLDNVKPRDEVDTCRKNIIINRLQEQSAIQAPLRYKIPEIQVYNELKKVNEEIEKTEARIREKKIKCDSRQEMNKSNYLIIESLKEKIEEEEMKILMFKLKSQKIEKETKEIYEINNSKGIVSISEEESQPQDAVSQLLQSLIEKVDMHSAKPKLLTKKTMFSSEMDISKFGSSIKSASSRKNQMKRMSKFGSCMNVSSKKSLFGSKFDDDPSKLMDELDQTCDLLPETCFDFKADDEFLIASQSTFDLKSFRTDTTNNFNVESFSKTFCQQREKQKKYFEKIPFDNTITQTVDEILSVSNKRIIWDALCSIKDDLLSTVKAKLENCNLTKTSKQISAEDKMELNFIYIKINLLTLKCEKRIEKLKNAIRKKKSEILSIYDEESDELESMFENIKKEAVCQFGNKGISSTKEVRATYIKLNKIKEELLLEVKNIKRYIQHHEDIIEKLKKSQTNTAICVRKLNGLLFDPEWMDALTENESTSEMTALIDFPLIQNKQLHFTNQNVFYRDLIGNMLIDTTESNDVLYMITTLLEYPQLAPEYIISNILKKKNKLRILSSIEFPKITFEKEKYTLEQLQQQESYIEPICEKLSTYIRSSKARQVLNSTNKMNIVVELWKEMPFRRYVSKNKKVNDKTYEEYEEFFSYLNDKK